MSEKTRHYRSPEERGAENQQIIDAQRALAEKMVKIQLFPGTLEEFNQFTGEQHEFIKIPDGSGLLLGGYSPLEVVDEGGDIVKVSVEKRDFLNPNNWRKMKFELEPRGGVAIDGCNVYREVLSKAVELGADAIVYYKRQEQVSGFYSFTPFRESGVPVRRMTGNSETVASELQPNTTANL